MPVTLQEYRALAQNAPKQWEPDPFTNPRGDWQRDHFKFEDAVNGMTNLLKRVRSGEVTVEDLKQSDFKKATRENTYGYWLYIQHHPPKIKNDWKRLGQRYWSVQAWASYRETGDHGLELDHVVPKKTMWERILEEPQNVRVWMERNLCCVLTVSQHNCHHLSRTTHPKPEDPWVRYKGSGIVLLHNSRWTEKEIEPLLRHGLVNRSSFPTSIPEES